MQLQGHHGAGRQRVKMDGGKLPAGRVVRDLVSFTDFMPTLAEFAGAGLPKGITLDGRSFAPQLRGQKGNPREWIYVQLGRNWYVKEPGWKLNVLFAATCRVSLASTPRSSVRSAMALIWARASRESSAVLKFDKPDREATVLLTFNSVDQTTLIAIMIRTK